MNKADKTIRYRALLTENGWIENAFVALDCDNKLVGITQKSEEINCTSIDGWAMPGFFNGHSHAFQYALGGLVENLQVGRESDDFWSWRSRMYELALTLSPEDMFCVAHSLYVQMRNMGYRHVTEFHYLHHQKNGERYSDISEMSGVLVRAAKKAGIGITLVPVYYNQGGFGCSAHPEQRRFTCRGVDEYFRIVDGAAKHCDSYDRASVGVGVHSLRAAKQDEIKEIFSKSSDRWVKHIHIAEQEREVEEAQAAWGARPVQWLLDNVEVNSSFNLVHATHLDEAELLGIVSSAANVVLCPTTEANLGDGFFPLLRFRELGGRWGIGSDSHVSVSPLEELRWLDYGQRLLHRKRNVLCKKGGEDSGEVLYRESLQGGRLACGINTTSNFAVGELFDPVVIASDEERFSHAKTECILSTLIYATSGLKLS